MEDPEHQHDFNVLKEIWMKMMQTLNICITDLTIYIF